MSWSKLKVALFTATTMLPLLAWGSCISGDVAKKIMQYATIGNVLD